MNTPNREQLLYWLHEAAEIEHNLMCCYLYAAFSLRTDEAAFTPAQAALVRQWSGSITAVALEEMAHLCLVGNLMNALGSPAHFNRPPFPVDSGPYPAGFVIRLQPFSIDTIEHFLYLERPAQAALADGAGFAPRRQYRRGAPAGRLSPGARDYDTVGALYDTLREAMQAFVAAHGEEVLFIGERALQVDAALAPLPGVEAVTDLASALRALDTIVTQGEGAGSDEANSHYCRFRQIAEQLRAAMAEAPGFLPAWPAATNPVMNAPPTPGDKVHINHPEYARWLDVGNAMYTTSLRCLLQAFSATERRAKAAWLSSSFALMRALVPVGQALASRPATSETHGRLAGLTFTPLRTLATLPASGAPGFVAERIGQLQARVLELGPAEVPVDVSSLWRSVAQELAQQAVLLKGLASSAEAPPAGQVLAVSSGVSEPGPASASASVALSPIEVAEGRALTVLFEGRRCIHSRHCVLEAPAVFKANTPGAWIDPDAAPVALLVAVAQRCPSGAIRYERHDGEAGEQAPPVNTLLLRENGPYAVHAPLTVAGQPDGWRATLCRCGRSANKPWCDGAHAAAGFIASGDPPTGTVDALLARDGPLAVLPLRDGPLRMQGNLEICAGTGRTLARTTDTRLCRCGQSKNKPFCDMSHVAAGFSAAGA